MNFTRHRGCHELLNKWLRVFPSALINDVLKFVNENISQEGNNLG